jgi:hypothetical protein
VLLKKVVLWLKRGQKGPFLREICPLKKMTPKHNAASGIIAGELLILGSGLLLMRVELQAGITVS